MLSVRAVFVAGILVSLLFAGCVQGDEPATKSSTSAGRRRAAGVPAFISEKLPDPVLQCYDGVGCNQEMTPDKDRQGNEVTIAVNPTNPRNIVGGAKDYYPADAGECVWDGIYVTHDGGATPYNDRSFDGSPWRQLSQPDPSKLNYASQFWCTTDPVVYFNTKGTFYYLLMAYQADRVTGSKTCKDICPLGALNDWAFNRAVQIVATSNDGGKSFQTFTPILDGVLPVFHDKGWIAASNDGVIHAMWLALVPGNLYFRSTDGGKSFSDPQLLAATGVGGGQGSFVDVGPGKEVYAAWRSGRGETLRRSFDEGKTWDAARTVINITGRSMPGLSSRDARGGFPHMATDKFADSPNAGAIYFVWQDGSKSDATDVLFSASFDKGQTFTPPIVLNDDYREDGLLEANNWQIFPTVSVSPLGVIDVSWMDSRLLGSAVLKPNNGGLPAKVGQSHLKLDQFHTYSLDGGKTWSQNFRVRDVNDDGWDPQVCHHQNGMIFIGDYNDIDSSWGAAHPVWPDSRSGDMCDVYTAIIQRPIFPDGFDEEKKNTWRQRLISEKLVEPDHPFIDR
ncbi:MAG TPA: sialidase family protein [Candidatus Thermoplasmatota archaeon]|nr:sialidase family protein [Candidatus Thermoplasmatota archaeon]